MMQTNSRKLWYEAVVLWACFFLVLLSVKLIDVQPIGPEGSLVGLSRLNAAVRDLFGYQPFWYGLTEITGLLAIAVAGGFAVLGLVQLIKRRSLLAVDRDILLLAALYVAVGAMYVLFEIVVINYRPILMEGVLEASFPSSHTMLACCILGAAMYQFGRRLPAGALRKAAVIACGVVIAVMAVGRLACGVHWFTDILGGIFLSGALVMTYVAAAE